MGHNPQLHKLYPEVQFPVSRGTPMISPLIKWHHNDSWYTYKFSAFTISDAEQKDYFISYVYDEYKFIQGHIIDGKKKYIQSVF